MSTLSLRFSRKIAAGRATPPHRSREAILAALLDKRAAANRAGMLVLEEQLRNQIIWALPMRGPVNEASGERDDL